MQQTSKVSGFLRWWFTPKLPIHYIFISPEARPKGFYKTIRVYFRTWVVHPLKRRLAKYYLALLQKLFELKVIAITGSAGKTTTKDMVASIMRQVGETAKSHANIDPVFNIPTTILKCTPKTKYLVLEMGVEKPGEIDFYLWLAKPNVGIITNIYQTHTQYFEDAEGVALEKTKLVKGLDNTSFAVLNNESNHLKPIAGKLKAHIVWFGKDGDVHASDERVDTNGTSFVLQFGNSKQKVQLHFIGKQFVLNALAAAAAATACGASAQDVKEGLESLEPTEHRMNLLHLKSGVIVLDDSYNSNPEAAKEALNTLKEFAGKRKTIAVLGDMLELGEGEAEEHQKLGKYAASLGIGQLIGVGNLSINIVTGASGMKNKPLHANTSDEALNALKPHLKNNTVVLIKASRSIGLDKLVATLQTL